jgi:hypothetical protein
MTMRNISFFSGAISALASVFSGPISLPSDFDLKPRRRPGPGEGRRFDWRREKPSRYTPHIGKKQRSGVGAGTQFPEYVKWEAARVARQNQVV